MKIGFFGAQGTGKTALIEAMQADPYFKHFNVIKSSSRIAKESGRPINKDAGRLDQLLITVNRCVSDLQTPGHVMSDRTPLDSIAYSLYQEMYQWPDDDVAEYYWATSLGLVQNIMPKYDRLYYFPVYWLPVADGVRIADPDYQKEIDVLMRKVAEDLELKYETVPDVSVSQRLGWLKAQLEFDSL